MKLIQHLRNEAHRFSLEHHRKRRSKAALRSELDDIAGVGPKTRHALLAHFKTVDSIRNADETALLEVVNLKVAKAIQAHFAEVSGSKRSGSRTKRHVVPNQRMRLRAMNR